MRARRSYGGVPFLHLALALVACRMSSSLAKVACQTDNDCVVALQMEGTKCDRDGWCTNPFYQGGCLSRMLPGWKKIRTCNSDDPPSAAQEGFCRPSPLDYNEVRIANQGWESAFFVAWIQQIILSEILDIPVTIETGDPAFNSNLYDVNTSFGYGTASDMQALTTGYQVGDCRSVRNHDPDKYVACSHAISEYWLGSESIEQYSSFLQLYELGYLAIQHWYVPKFTVERDPSLTSYVGLAGEKNRRKLAERFLRPTTWKDYCDEVSQTQCEVDDGVSSRRPISEAEEESFFAAGVYTGHFRATDKNNCDANPFTCSGHFGDYPCYFSGSVEQIAHHLNIALESEGGDSTNGYTYSQMTQIWDAANATKSDVIMIWWESEALYQTYLGSDAEFTKIVLPPPTQECLDNMVYGNRCDMDIDARHGDPMGACDFPPRFLSTVVSSALKDNNQERSELLRSPAYDALKNYRISELQIGQIFRHWLSRGIDKYNFDPRWATCRWVVENFASVRSLVPATYPRVVELEDFRRHPLFVVALVLSICTVLLLALAALLTRIQRKSRAVFYVQEPFLYSILGGLGLVTIGSILLALPPNDRTCTSNAWLTNIGYVIAFVPYFVRITAISTMLQSGKKMQRVRLTQNKLFQNMAAFASLVVAFLIVWTLLDAPRKMSDYELTDRISDLGETIVHEIQHCGSDEDFWMTLTFVWQGFLLLACLMLLSMALAVKEDINDTRSMAVAVVCHSCFFLSRLAIWLFGSSGNPRMMMGYLSLLISLECLGVLLVYVGPKFLDSSKGDDLSEADPDLFICTTIIMVEVAGLSAWSSPDLFICTTIIMVEVAGLSAWSSVREPVQVFKFLEIVHGAFDDLLDQRKLFKVETSGGCYVAAAGIPRPQGDHMLVAARFAWDCMKKMHSLSHELEILFGPDTSTLTLRIGMHSGPVTGGFLKGKGARFQLFGDTVNTTVHLVRSCEKGFIHVSSDTAKLLAESGKAHWVKERPDSIQTHNRGLMKTYLLKCKKSTMERNDNGHDDGSSGVGSEIDTPNGDNTEAVVNRHFRLIEWNVTVLHKLIKQIVARRTSMAASTLAKTTHETVATNTTTSKSGQHSSESGGDGKISSSASDERMGTGGSISGRSPSMPLDEVKEIISLPSFDHRSALKQQKQDIDSIHISDVVLEELKLFVTSIAQMYRDNPFHNFAHASHVVMAVTKYMNRINEARDLDLGDYKESKLQDKKYASALHDHTYGITSDPLTQFACVFSALIHDVDHPGVPNPQLIRENGRLAAMYRCRSVAEQNSFDLSWNLLMDERFHNLCVAICATPKELLRFRQLVINSVMATDLGDKELKDLRNGRWSKAFSPVVDSNEECSVVDNVNRKATIVVEHLIQAADVSHTTQHWEVYRVWNENLFRELYKAYCDGRAERNPADFWYEGEIGFFDFYIIPLSKKLRDCGVFGLTSDENLNYATHNRQLWVEKGVGIVAEMLEKAEKEFGTAKAHHTPEKVNE